MLDLMKEKKTVSQDLLLWLQVLWSSKMSKIKKYLFACIQKWNTYVAENNVEKIKENSLMAQWVKDLVLSLSWLGLLLWHGCDPWPRNFDMLRVHENVVFFKPSGSFILFISLLFNDYIYVVHVIVRENYSSSEFPKNTPHSTPEREGRHWTLIFVLVLKPLAPGIDLVLYVCLKFVC